MNAKNLNVRKEAVTYRDLLEWLHTMDDECLNEKVSVFNRVNLNWNTAYMLDGINMELCINNERDTL